MIKKYCSAPICIDAEGAQIRTKVKKQKKYNTGSLDYIYKCGNNFHLYPASVFNQIKKNDILEIGFDNLKIKIISLKIIHYYIAVQPPSIISVVPVTYEDASEAKKMTAGGIS